ncbi:hypothetical protein E3P99_03910 [Wallemia hederae]|uniref:AB hydrolase-1 domain-containing protein n=1 Tax=Wallemia hederae TaxID=1540922 RepID=A0A4T0FD12_9BASI|nr:hypothetical protein E3P99_03910 [Wallemia hederae]
MIRITTRKINQFGTPLISVLRRAYSNTTPRSVELAYEKEDGNRIDEAIILCHGWIGSKQNMRTVSRKLATPTQSPSYNLDLRNHGSSPHAEPHDYAHMAADIAAFIDTHQLQNVTLIGHSLGGKAGMELALTHPHLLRRLVIVDITPKSYETRPAFYTMTEGMQAVERAGVRSRRQADAILAKYEPRAELRKYLLTNMVYTHANDTHMHCKIPVQIINNALTDLGTFPYQNAEKQFSKPTTILKALNSPFLNHDDFLFVRKLFPAAEFTTIKSGHFVHLDEPDTFTELVASHIEKDRRGAAG